MLRSGAAGLTKKEITRGLRLSNELSDSQIHNGYKSMITTLKVSRRQREHSLNIFTGCNVKFYEILGRRAQ